MNESDVKLAMRQPWVNVNNDASGVNPEGPLGRIEDHPRAYELPRILGKSSATKRTSPSLTPSANSPHSRHNA